MLDIIITALMILGVIVAVLTIGSGLMVLWYLYKYSKFYNEYNEKE